MIFMTTEKKYSLDLTVKEVQRLHERYVLIRLTDSQPLPPMRPGQFVEARVDGSPTTFLRRPISINFVDTEQNELWLLVAIVGDGTRRLAQLSAGDRLNCVLPLGNGFTIQSRENVSHTEGARDGSRENASHRVLLVGGGVGVAPLLYLGKVLHDAGTEPTFLLGARTAGDLLMLDEFAKYGRVCVTTEDGSMGERGFVTQHTLLYPQPVGTDAAAAPFDLIQCCGPTPMMKAVARYAREKGIACEVSLENLMACGLGACLCCVEKVLSDELNTRNVCVCKEGPVFNINRLLWQS
jgi:dihydroorotate dehydrogenase electron transfer subunit